MFQSKEEEEKLRQAERLIDWELRRQLSHTVLVLTFLSAAIALLGSRLVNLRGGLYLESTFKVQVNFVFLVIYILMVIGLDAVFYRLASSFVRMREFEDRLPEEMKALVREKNPMGGFFDWFVKEEIKKGNKQKTFSLRKERVWFLIILGDILLIAAVASLLFGVN